MKSFLLLTLIATPLSHATVIGFWDFNNGFSVADEPVQIVHAASIGSGMLYQQRADIDSNGKGGLTFVDAANGINNTGAANERAIAWDDLAKSGDNDAEIFITLDTSGFQDLMLSFDARADSDPDSRPSQFDLKADTDPLVDVGFGAGTIKDFAVNSSTEILNNQDIALTDTLTRFTYDLSTFGLLNNQGTLAIRLDSFKGPDEDGQLRIDNLLITGTAVPEPSSALLALAGLTILARRRR